MSEFVRLMGDNTGTCQTRDAAEFVDQRTGLYDRGAGSPAGRSETLVARRHPAAGLLVARYADKFEKAPGRTALSA